MGRSGNSKKRLFSSSSAKTRARSSNANQPLGDQFLSREGSAQQKANNMSIAELESEVMSIYDAMRYYKVEGYHKSNTKESQYNKKVVLSHLTGGTSNEYANQIERMTMVRAALEALVSREGELNKYNQDKFGGDEWDSRTEVTAQGCQEILNLINPFYQEAKNNASAVDYQDAEDYKKREKSVFSKLWMSPRNW
jgi:hypothetical protein